MKIKDREKLFEELGKYFTDVSKLVLGGIVLSVIVNLPVHPWALLITGALATVLTGVTGFLFTYISFNKKQ
jgi:hypothetical protein